MHEPKVTTPGAAPDETLLAGYVERALALLAAGQPLDVAELCREHPGLAATVAEAVALRADVAMLERRTGQRDPNLGKVLLGRYRLDHELGAGAMGVVYRGTDLSLQRPVAVKLLQERLAGDPGKEQRFTREAQALAALRHANVVPIHDRGTTEDGMAFLVMALLDGASLGSLLEAGSARVGDAARLRADTAWLGELLGGTPPERSWVRLVARFCQSLANALGAAHAAQVLHRDVKPSNLFVTRAFVPVLLDFGLARRAQDAALTTGDSALGTPSYMAPEQAGGAAIGPAADIYGLAATLYHLLALRPPFEGEVLHVLAKLRSEDPPSLRKLAPELPADLVAIVEKGMEKSPERRYPSMAALEQDLAAFLEHRPVRVRPVSRAGRLLRRARRQPARAAAVLTSLLALALLAALLPLEAAARERARQDEKAALAATLPAHIAIEGDPERPSAQELGQQQENLALVDRLLELDPGDLPLRLVRAALRLDRGEHRSAAADLQQLATQQASPYLRAVAARYQAASQDARGMRAVDLGDLGAEPASPMEHFVAGFHALRSRQQAGYARAAVKELDLAAEAYLPARDLRLIALAELGAAAELAGDRSTARQWFRLLLAEAYTLEGVYGRKTARTRFAVGTACVGLEYFQDAIQPLEDSLALRPARHGPWQNLGTAHHRRGDLERAAECMRQADALRPGLLNTAWTRVLIARDARHWTEARDLARRLPAAAQAAEPWRVPQLLGDIALQEEMVAAYAGDQARAKELAEEATTHLDAALRTLEPFPRREATAALLGVQRQVAVAIAAGNRDQACRDLICIMGGGGPRPYALRSLAELLPEQGLGPEATKMLRLYLRALACFSAPEDPKLRQ